MGLGNTRGGGSWQKEGPQSPPGFLSHPSVFISSLFPEIRMSKPLEAEKQSLDSPSEHTGEDGQRQGSGQVCRDGWQHALSFPLQTLKEMDPTLTIRSG